MATGGIFQLITNDGKQDRMLMATALLNKRLMDIEKIRSRNPNIKDPTPTLVDIEKTHILFMNAHFKPFAAIGYEYNKVRVQSGTARLGSTVQFSIPQFGDFFHDMVLHIKLGAVSADDANDSSRFLQYYDFLGQKLVKNVKFQVNGNPLDEYDSDVHCFHEKFFVTPNKQTGWNRGIGQQMAHKALSTNAGGRGSGVEVGVDVFDGPQTPKADQGQVELWVPLLFWFNKDPRLAIPSVSIPYGQRFIDVELAEAKDILQHVGLTRGDDNPGANPPPIPEVELMELYINNVFVNPEIHDIFIKRIGFTLIRVHRRQVLRVNKANDQLLMNQLKWPIETLYIGLRPTDNTDYRLHKSLKSWHVFAETQQLATDLCSVRETWRVDPDGTFADPANPTVAELDAAALTVSNTVYDLAGGTFVDVANPTVAELNARLVELGLPQLSGTFADADNPTVAELVAASPSPWCRAYYDKCVPTLDTISIEAHGVPLYPIIPASFFNHYVPYTFGGHHISTPEDCGALMVTFNFYPGSYQPSGHVNISRAREFYLNYVSPTVGDTIDSADMVIIAVAINFLLISDGSAILRYST
jgi:hypothetical protein